MRFKLAAMALFTCVAMLCSDSNGQLLDRMLGRSGCGDCEAVSSCCDTPAPACATCDNGGGCRLLGGGGGGYGLLSGGGGCDCNLLSGGGGGCLGGECGGGCKLFSRGGGCLSGGCGGGCGGGLLARLFSGCGGQGVECDCEMAPLIDCGPTCDPEPCGCGGGGLLSRGMFSGGLFSCKKNKGGCGCDTGCSPAPEPASCCGCDSAPAPSCGCDNAPKCGCRRTRVRKFVSAAPRPFQNSGCPSCGCDSPAACSSGCAGCAAPADIGGTIYDPTQAIAPQALEPQAMEPAIEPVIVPEPTEEGSIVVPGADDGAYNERQPLLDPSAFVISNN